MKYFWTICFIMFLVIIIALFLELYYSKTHACVVMLCPRTIVRIPGERIHDVHDVIIYNTLNCRSIDAFDKLDEKDKDLYKDVPIKPHYSEKITKPFSDSFEDLKEGFAEVTPVSFMYKTALGVVGAAREVLTPNIYETPYRMLVCRGEHHVAFYNNEHIYVK